MRLPRINWIEKHPVEAVIFVYSLGLAIYALFVLSPYYIGDYGNSIAQGFPSRTHELMIGGFFLGSSVPGLMAPFNQKIPNVFLEWGTFNICLSFLFLTILRIMLYGLIPFTWLNLLVISITAGILRIYLRAHRN